MRTFIILLCVYGTFAFKRISFYHGRTGRGNSKPHSYPASPGYSGNHYAPSNVHNRNHIQTTNIHNHYYSPPQHIGYGGHSYPIYHGVPPTYVYTYRDSGSRFDNLLTGLALYNLGRMSAHNDHYDGSREYRGPPGEICKLRIRKSNGDFEETRVDCRLMASFDWQDLKETAGTHQTRTVSQTVTQTTNATNGTVTVTNTTVVNALDVKGESLKVTSGMTCHLIRTVGYVSKESTVSCGVLQQYAQSSWRPNCSMRVTSISTLFIVQLVLLTTIT